MKNIALIIGALLFSTLFYNQNLGLNLTLFSLVTILVLILFNPKAFKNKNTIILTILYTITAVAFFFYQSTLSITANCLAFITLVGNVSQRGTSIFINWINGLYTIIAGFFHRNFTSNENHPKQKKEIDYVHLIKIIGIPLIFIGIFIALYKNGNPVFNKLISEINFNFINIQWILISLLGYYILYNISSPLSVNPATKLDLTTGNILLKSTEFSLTEIRKENQLGTILVALLNILIVFFLITDFTFLFSKTELNPNIYSNQVHSGIYALIGSIIIAITILLYFFRGNLNFYSENRTLKILSYFWIILNTILVINTLIKDYQYIYYFGLTYKRMGVLIYLLLTIIGLITTSIKILNVKNIWYLLRINSLAAFIILITGSMINWDKHITYYNINYAKSIDFNYLLNLSNNNTLLLKFYSDKKVLTEEYRSKVNTKFLEYEKTLKTNNWQEYTIDNLKYNFK